MFLKHNSTTFIPFALQDEIATDQINSCTKQAEKTLWLQTNIATIFFASLFICDCVTHLQELSDFP